MPNSFMDAYMRGVSLAKEEQRKQVEEQHADDLHKLQLEHLNLQMKSLKFDQKAKQLGLHPNAPEITVPKSPLMPSQISQSPDLPGSALPNPAPMQQSEGTRSVPMPLPNVQFGPDEGFDSPVSAPMTSNQQWQELLHGEEMRKLQQEMGMKAFESGLKEHENAAANNITLPPGLIPGQEQPLTMNKAAMPLLTGSMSQAAQDKRQNDQQDFTSSENAKRLQAESERAKADRASRESIAAASRVQKAAQAAKSGAQSKTVTQALSISSKFDASPTVRDFNVIKEAVQFAQSLSPTTVNPQDDQGLIYAFAKAMDPNSVVREGEYATVQKYAQSWADKFGFDIKRLYSNSTFLTSAARENMKATILAKAKATETNYKNLRSETAKKFQNIKEDPESWLTDYGTVGGAAPDAGGWSVKVKPQ